MNTQPKTGSCADEEAKLSCRGGRIPPSDGRQAHGSGELLSCLQEASCESSYDFTEEQSGSFSDDQSKKARISALSDENLFQLCRKFGEQARLWRQKFAGLLPEVYRRRLYEKKGFGSIFEFAKKLAGMSEEQVRRVLNIGERFRDKPILKEMLENGDVSVNKLARIVSVATQENQLFWAAQAKVLSQSALSTLVRDQKTAIENGASSTLGEVSNGLQQPKNGVKSVRAHTNVSQNLLLASAINKSGGELYLSPEVHSKLLELQNKGIDINQLLMEFLEKRELEIEREKMRLAQEAEAKGKETTAETKTIKQVRVSRYIPIVTRRLLQKEYGTKCALPNCKNEAQAVHHAARFALAQNHNPYYLAPLCKAHHQIAHSIDAKFHEAHGRTIR